MSTEVTAPLRLLRATQVCNKLNISKTTLYAKLDKNSKYYDPEFPKQINLGGKAVAWIESQIDSWILSKVSAL